MPEIKNANQNPTQAYQIALVIVGVVVTVPAFLIGSIILMSLGLLPGALSIACGCIIIALLAAMTMRLGAKNFSSTVELSEISFGSQGAKVISLILCTTLLGWFAITANLFGVAASTGVAASGYSIDLWILISLGSLLVAVSVIYGFKFIRKISAVLTPLMFIVLAFGAYKALDIRPLVELVKLAAPALELRQIASPFSAISLVIGALSVAAVIAPDIGRFAKTPQAASKAAMIGYALGAPLVLLLAGIPALVLGSSDLAGNYAALGIGLFALFLIPTAIWTTNVGNLYSANLAVADAGLKKFPIISCLALCFIGTVIAINIDLTALSGFLTILSILIPPIAGVYLCDGYALGRQSDTHEIKNVDYSSFIAWAIGVLVGWGASQSEQLIFSIPALLSILGAFVMRYVFYKTHVWEGQ